MQKKNINFAIITFISIFICHFVIFLAFYPGLCTYDLNTQIEQYTSHAFITNHPLLHTLFVGFFHDLFANEAHGFNYNLGYALATIIQMVIVDISMTYAILYIKQRSQAKILYIVCILFYAVFPVNSLLTISHTKDVLFAAFGMVFFIDSLHFISDGHKNISVVFFIRMIICAAFMLLLRNNALYAMAATILVLCIAAFISYRKKKTATYKNYVAVLIFSLILSILANKSLMIATDATNGSIKEMMSIPAQIMGRIYNTVATEDEKALISEYIPNASEYKYYISDPMKKDLPFEIWESKCKHFLLDSTILALHHPVISIQAVWYNIQGYVDPFHQPYSSDHFFLARHDYRGDAVQDSKLPMLCDLYVDHFRLSNVHNPLTVFFNMALYIWIFIAGFICLIKHNDRQYLAYIFALFYLLTLLLGPAAIVRYGFFYILISPIILNTLLPVPKK